MSDKAITEELEKLARAIDRLVSVPPIPAIPPIPPIPAILPIPAIPPISPSADHDILIAFQAEAKIEFNNIRKDIGDIKKTLQISAEDHETRIRSLEQNRWKLAGAATGLASVAAIIVSIIVKLISK